MRFTHWLAGAALLAFASTAHAQTNDAGARATAREIFETIVEMDTSVAGRAFAHGLNERVPVDGFYNGLDHWRVIINELAVR